jgi:DnaA regulatory inactivator Hda
MKQIPLAIGALGAGPEQTFDNYLCAANAPAVAHLRGLGEHAAPVYLWGPQGSGKTHLLHALTRRVQGQGGQVGWFCSRDALPWVHDEQRSLVVLDGCDLFDAPRQQAAFALFAQAAASGIGVLAAGRLPPVDLPLREDLRTRLAWGHVFALQPPGEAERRAVLRREADRRAVFLSDELMDYVLARFDRDLKALMDLVDRLDRFSLANKRAITVPMLKRMLAEDEATPRAAGRGLTLFDLDHTLLPIDSDHAWGEFLAANAWVDGDEFRRQNDHFFAQYQAGRLDIDAYVMSATAPLRSRSPADARALHARFMHEVIVPRLQPQALALVRDHQARGDAIALVTATNDFVTAPIAAALGIDTLIAVRLARDAAGQVTGHIDGTPSYREGKVTRVEQWLATSGRTWADFDRISVYSDSMNDLPLLERATDPVATNPSPQLEALALLRGWRILRLFA